MDVMDIHYICSFGPACHTATFMWRNQLKLMSYPFDWIYADNLFLQNTIKSTYNFVLKSI